MYAINPPWDPRWTAFRGGPGRHGGPRAAFRAAMAGPDEHEHPHHEHDHAHDPGHDAGEHGRPGPGRRGRRHGGPRFGPGFGPGFPPGFPPGPPRGFGRRGRRTNRGDIRSAVLVLVAEQPRHGYEIIQQIAERSGGAWKPSPGSVYPTLSQLEDEGLVVIEQAEGRRVVRLSEEGVRYVAEHRAELDRVWESVGRDPDDDTAELWVELSQLHAAAHQVLATGTPEQIQTATTALADARKAIYRLLAE